MLIGTAGHIDRGKTSHIRRLSGRDTDRLPKECRRGISIELGYAYAPLGVSATSEEVLGFIDVPGHEKFVHTMVTGAACIDRALMISAADDGLMPQTEMTRRARRRQALTTMAEAPDCAERSQSPSRSRFGCNGQRCVHLRCRIHGRVSCPGGPARLQIW